MTKETTTSFYDGFTRDELIAEIIALKTNNEERVAKRVGEFTAEVKQELTDTIARYEEHMAQSCILTAKMLVDEVHEKEDRYVWRPGWHFWEKRDRPGAAAYKLLSRFVDDIYKIREGER